MGDIKADDSSVRPLMDTRNQEIRQNLLGLARDILGRNAHMEWEANKTWNPVTVDSVIEEADKLYKFVGDEP